MGKNRQCRISDCQRRFKGLGLCTLHYQQFKKHGRIVSVLPKRDRRVLRAHPIINGKRACTTCNKSLSLEHYRKDKAAPSGYTSQCKDCFYVRNRAYRAKPEIRIRDNERSRRYKARPEVKLRNKLLRAKRPKYRYRPTERFLLKARLKAARRRAQKRKACPDWLSTLQKLEIQTFYQHSKEGILEVDHIIPLKNSMVCGLHVPWNLQLLTPHENALKNNSFDGTNENNEWRSGLPNLIDNHDSRIISK